MAETNREKARRIIAERRASELREIASLQVGIGKMMKESAQATARANVVTSQTAAPRVNANASRGGGPRSNAPAGREGMNMKRSRDKQRDSRGDFHTIESGTSRYLFVQAGEGRDWFVAAYEAWIPGMGEDGKNLKIVSPRSTDPDAPCAATMCGEMLKARASNKEEKEEARNILPKERFMANVFLFNSDANAWEPKILQFPYTVWKGVNDAIWAELTIDDLDEHDNIIGSVPVVGVPSPRIVQIKKTGEAKNTRYAVTVTAKAVELTTDQLAHRVDLDELIVPTPNAEIETALCGYFQVNDLAELTADGGAPPTRAGNGGGGQRPAARGSSSAPEPQPQKEIDEPPYEEPPYNDDPDPEIPLCIAAYDPAQAAARGCEKCFYKKDCMGAHVSVGVEEEL